jgi:hypothetical protein
MTCTRAVGFLEARPDSTSLEVLELHAWIRNFRLPVAGVAELADALDSKSSDREIVWVRAPPPAP